MDWSVMVCACMRVFKDIVIFLSSLGNLLSGLMDSLTGATGSTTGPAAPLPKPPLDASQEELD